MNETDQDDATSDKSIFGAEFVRRGISKDVIIDLTTVSHEDVSVAGKSARGTVENLNVDFLAEADASVEIDLTEADSLVGADSLIGAGSAATALTTTGDAPKPGNTSLFGERTPLPKLQEPDDGAGSEALKKIAALPVGESLFDRSVPSLAGPDGDSVAPVDFVPVEESSFGPWWLRPMLVVGARTALAGVAVVALFTFWPSGDAEDELETTREPLTSTTVVAAPAQEPSIVSDAPGPSTLLTPVTTLAIATAEVASTDAPAAVAPVAATPTTVRRRPVTTQPPATAGPTTTVVVSTTVVATSPPPTFGTTAKPVTTVTPTTATPATPAPTTPVTPAPTTPATLAPTTPATPAPTSPASSAITDEAGQ